MEKDSMEVAMSTDVILETVMKHLRVRDLLSCRKACKFWNKQASFVLRKRSTMIKAIPNEDELMKLQECMKQSWDFPFAGLKFDHPWRLNSPGAMGFFKMYGERFTHLCLDIEWKMRLTHLAPFINHLTRLSILEMGHHSMDSSSVMDSDAGRNDGQVLMLPSVRTFRISTRMVNEDVLNEVLAALSPSVQIECLRAIAMPEILVQLKNAGKLRAVSSIRVYDNSGLGMDDFLSTELPSLTKLNYTCDEGRSLDWLEALLCSSQNTLKELHMDGMIFAKLSFESSVFAKLTTLSLSIEMYGSRLCLFQGENGDKFPVLKELKLNIERGHLEVNWSDGLFVVPSVTQMELDRYLSQDEMKQLAQAFPNVAQVLIFQDYCTGTDGGPLLTNPFKIWHIQEFKNLEKLKIWNYIIDWPTKDYINMDSLLTGMPVGICNRLRKQEQVNLTNSPFNEILRESPNILQLKNLRELIVCVEPERGFELTPEDVPFISMVSVWYTLQMMPNLQAKFVYYDNGYEDGTPRLSALKAAFEDVKEYIKLEPFFC